jgi:hypothetical protein
MLQPRVGVLVASEADKAASYAQHAASRLSVLHTGIGALAQRLVAIHSLRDDEQRMRNLALGALMQTTANISPFYGNGLAGFDTPVVCSIHC